MARQGLVIVMLALALAGCGRRGALEPPPSAAAPAASADKPVVSGADVALTPSKAHKPPPIQPGNQPFILDPLL